MSDDDPSAAVERVIRFAVTVANAIAPELARGWPTLERYQLVLTPGGNRCVIRDAGGDAAHPFGEFPANDILRCPMCQSPEFMVIIDATGFRQPLAGRMRCGACDAAGDFQANPENDA